MRKFLLILLTFIPSLASSATRRTDPRAPLHGYVVHFDFFENAQEGIDLVGFAKSAGAKVINVVPPAHVWERPDAQVMLDAIIDNIEDRHLKFVITRVDAAYPPDRNGERINYLYEDILDRPGVMNDGQPTVDWFKSTVGLPEYNQWMEDETRYYAGRYGGRKNFIGFNLGPFSEPFVSQRGGFLQYDFKTKRYQLTQYTPEVRSLIKKTTTPDEADYVRAINDWFVDRYEACRKIWHDTAARKDIPFLLQFSGFDQEKFELGAPVLAGLNRKDWAQRADAIGLSLYLNGGYWDMGRSSITSLVRLLHDDWKISKPVFVLESGVENPTPVLDMNALAFLASAVNVLHPVTFIYEFLKDPFYVTNEPNSGRLLTREQEPRQSVVRAIKHWLRGIR